jgi:hypothetical protein
MSMFYVPTLFERIETLRTCSGLAIEELITGLSLESKLPMDWLNGLETGDRITCFRAVLLCYCVTSAAQIPREMQLRAVLADQAWT